MITRNANGAKNVSWTFARVIDVHKMHDTMKKPASSKSQPQVDKFKAMAKEVGADDSEKSFDALLKKVALPEKAPSKR